MSSYKNYIITVEFHLNGSREWVIDYIDKACKQQSYEYEIVNVEEE